MASNLGKFIKEARPQHTVGNISSWGVVKTFTNGAKAKEDLDVFRLVELEVSADKEFTCKYATATAKEGSIFLHVTPQHVLEMYGEQRADFYVGTGEMANIAYLEKGMTFFTSAISGTYAIGDFVVWDAAKKEFISKATPAVGDIHVFQIQDIETEESYTIDGATIVELRVVK